MRGSWTRREFLRRGALAAGAGVGAARAAGRARAEGGAAEAPASAERDGAAGEPREKLPPRWTILNYDERMSYRRLGKTGLWVSAVSLGGHWKRCPFEGAAFEENRTQVMARCLESGFNYVDACWKGEVEVYARALAKLGKRKQIYFGFDSHGSRGAAFRTRQALIADLETTMRETGLDYVDLWRVTCHEPGGLHTFNEACEFAAAGEKAVRDGKARFFGLSTHDRRWADFVVREFPIVSVIITPYTPGTNELAHASFFDTVRKHDVGILGIKPFASNALFRGSSQPGDPYEEADHEAARLALRHVLRNDAIAAPIPGLIFPSHVDNCLRAIEERRKFDLAAGPAAGGDRQYERAVSAMWARLPAEYAWLRDWEWV